MCTCSSIGQAGDKGGSRPTSMQLLELSSSIISKKNSSDTPSRSHYPSFEDPMTSYLPLSQPRLYNDTESSVFSSTEYMVNAKYMSKE